MAKARHRILLDKAVNACLAAIEIYNKPRIEYREETFAILMLNAWELLLKAHIIKESGGDHRSIEVTEPARKRDGSPGKRKRRRLNRSGNPVTIGLDRAIGLVREYQPPSLIDEACTANLDLLLEIRDNAVHFYNADGELARRVHEVGTAALMNFATAAQAWFDLDLTRQDFHILPVAFRTPDTAGLLGGSRQMGARRLLEHIASQAHDIPSEEGFQVAVPVELRFMRSSGDDALRVRVVRDDDHAVPVEVQEEDIFRSYPWDYRTLTAKLKARYSDFLQNQRYHDVRKQIENDGKHHRVRYLDPTKKGGTKKKLYSPGILREFDGHYTRRRNHTAT